MNKCIFCGKKEKRSKEHVWPQWLQNKMYGTTYWAHHGTHVSPTGKVISTRTHSGSSLVLGDVCIHCNSGWMSHMENDFKNLLDKLALNPNSINKISKKDRDKICAWVFKTVLVINTSTNYRKIVPDKHYKYLYTHQNVPQKDVKIDYTRIIEEKKLNWAQTQTMQVFLRRKKALTPDIVSDKNKYNISLQIGNLGFKVIWFEGLDKKKYKFHYDTDECLRILPYKKNMSFNFKKTGFENLISFGASTVLVV